MTKSPWPRIESRLQEMGISPRRASLLASGGKNADILRTMKDGRSTLPRAQTLVDLARVLQVSVDWITAPNETPPPPFDKDKLARAVADIGQSTGESSVVEAADLPLDIPVLGTVAASTVGAFVIGPEAIEYVRRPPGLRTAKNAYAVYVRGSSMEPRHRPGDLLFVSPDRPAAPGDDVIVIQQAHDHAPAEALLKIFVRETPSAVIGRQLNPEGTIEFRRETLKAVHRVLTVREMFSA